MRIKASISLLLLALSANAQNPVIRDQFCADPTARVFGNRIYVYPSHDITPPEGQRQDWFCMEDYHVFSSENLTDWTDHGMIISQTAVPWGKSDGYSMWAPECVCKDGKYYFYFPNGPKNGRGFAIGVATADHPEGPFTCEPEPIKGISGIDPCVLLDDDGSAYIYWSGMGIRGAKLKANMKEVDGELKEMRFPQRPDAQQNTNAQQMPPMLVAGETMEGLPDGFKEGPHAFKRNGWYYLTFPWVRVENGTETLAYAMSKSPLGPWDFKGIFMAEHPNGCWTNHHSFVEYKGQWYLFYHTNFFSPKDDKRRSVCIEKVTFNADGTIQEVKETMRGVGINQATERIEIDRFSTSSVGVSTEYVDTANTTRGGCVTLPQKGSWVKYNDVDFSSITDGYMVISAKASDNTEFFIRDKAANGKVIARVKMTVKPETPQGAAPAMFRRDLSNQWLTQTASLEYTPKGVTDLVITCEGAGVSVDWVQFKNRPEYFAKANSLANMSAPDAEGYIHRWMLLEPIKQDIRSNVVFTNTWLREAFSKTYFKNQLTVLPKDGQQVKVGAQTLKWHALDSKNFNVKLFRFAEKWGDQTYGSLFWGVTTIDCPQDYEDVRLAAGSNGASIWWVDGEEVLLLEGDRRMVEDDGMSKRLQLKKGTHTIRFALINGPGLSDFCVRFLDEKGQPVTNYTIKQQ